MNDSHFATAYTVIGEVTNGTESVTGVRTELIYSRVGQVTPKGAFYGGEELSRRLVKILLTGRARFRAEWSSSSASFLRQFSVEGIRFEKYEGPFETDKLCEFECNQLDVITDYEFSESVARSPKRVTLMYAIPKRRELLFPRIPESLKEGMPPFNEWLEYETSLGKMTIGRRNFVRGMHVEFGVGTFSYDELSLSFDVARDGRPAGDIIDEADKIVERYERIISFIVQCETYHYKREVNYFDQENVKLRSDLSLLRRRRVVPKERPILFEWGVTNELLKALIPMVSNHTRKDDIHETITLFLAGVESGLGEARLILHQSAIETLVNSVKEDQLLPNRICVNCGKDLKSLRDYILGVVEFLRVQMDDVYPSVSLSNVETFPFVKYRNAIAHGRRKEINYKDLPRELYRQQLLLERLIFHWIGLDAREIGHLKLWPGVSPF